MDWRDIPGWPGYEASDDGLIRSTKGNRVRLLRQAAKGNGYLSVALCKAGEPSTQYVHRLVLNAFRGPCPPGMECRHLDGNRANNRLENLAWGTRQENRADMFRHGTAPVGERNPSSKMTTAGVVELRERYAAGEYVKDLAKRFAITGDMVRLIATGQAHAEAGGPITLDRQERKGSHHPNAKLTRDQVIEIRSLRHQMSAEKAARLYGVSRSTVGKIHAGITYRND